jgi:hypothetical protein
MTRWPSLQNRYGVAIGRRDWTVLLCKVFSDLAAALPSSVIG